MPQSDADLDYIMPFLAGAWAMLLVSSLVLFYVTRNRQFFLDIARTISTKLIDKPAAQYTKAQLAFSVSIIDSATATLETRVHFTINCNERSELYMFWGTDTNLLAQLSLAHSNPTGDIITLFRSHSLSCQGPVTLLAKPEPQKLTAEPEPGIDLGPPPRRRVPLVLLSCSNNSAAGDSDITNLVTVVHVRDRHCRDVTGKLNELVRLQRGDWLPLYKYYSSDETVETGMCVVCREGRVTRILLPCRHACLCNTCSKQLTDHCPMCRCIVSSSALI